MMISSTSSLILAAELILQYSLFNYILLFLPLVYAATICFSSGLGEIIPRQNFRYHYGIIWVSFSVLRYHFGIAKFHSSFGHFLGSILKVSYLKPERSSRHYGILLVSLETMTTKSDTSIALISLLKLEH